MPPPPAPLSIRSRNLMYKREAKHNEETVDKKRKANVAECARSLIGEKVPIN